MRDEIIEVMARAVAGVLGHDRDVEEVAEAALTAYESHLQAEGMAVVPVEPTDAMVLAGANEIASPSPQTDAREAWEAMLAAALPTHRRKTHE